MIKSRQSVERRFWKHVIQLPDAPGCWLWVGATGDRGYGNIQDDYGQAQLVHRLSFRMHRGEITNGLLVRHRCDTPCCVNPEHLELGTQSDNLQDMLRRGRRPFRRTEGRPKIHAATALEIREQARRGVRQCDLAVQFKLSGAQISSIVLRKSWRFAEAAA